MSPRLRLDLVLNDFVAGAIASRKITVLSDGTPWRPLIDVKDMAAAVDWAVARDAASGGDFLVVNTGSNEWNYQVRNLAEAVAGVIPGVEVSINSDAQADTRSYRVDFGLFRSLAPHAYPACTLDETVVGLRDGLVAMGFNDQDFRNSRFIRLKILENLTSRGLLDGQLRWTFRSRTAA